MSDNGVPRTAGEKLMRISNSLVDPFIMPEIGKRIFGLRFENLSPVA